MEKVIDGLRGNWVTAKIGLNPSVFVKQLGSSINYAEQMPTVKWTAGLLPTWPKESMLYA